MSLEVFANVLVDNAVEAAAKIADLIADQLDSERARFAAIGSHANAAEMAAGARSARRTAIEIRKLKTELSDERPSQKH